MHIVFAGSIAFDYLMTFPGYFKEQILKDNLDSISLSFLADKMTKHRGGVAPNIAYTHALLGGNGTILGAAGQDFGEYRELLAQMGVDTRGIAIHPDLFTASFFANTDLANCQISTFYPGAMARAHECRIENLPRRPDLVVISPDDPAAMRAHVRECQELGIPYFYDPSQQIIRLDLADLAEGIAGAHLLIVNEYELHLLQDKIQFNIEESTKRGTVLAITRGKKGSVVHVESQTYHAPAFPTNRMIDPTGAGDSFRGAFLRGYALSLPWQVCAQMGSLAATYCLEHNGSQNHTYTPAQFVQRYREYFDDSEQWIDHLLA